MKKANSLAETLQNLGREMEIRRAGPKAYEFYERFKSQCHRIAEDRGRPITQTEAFQIMIEMSLAKRRLEFLS